LIHGPPKIVLLAVDLDEDFIDVEGVAVSTMLSFQAACINGSEFVAPEPDRFAADIDASFSEKIFNVSVAETESIVEPDCVGDDVRRKSVAFISIHEPILAISAL